jgi:hypothetical protein
MQDLTPLSALCAKSAEWMINGKKVFKVDLADQRALAG